MANEIRDYLIAQWLALNTLHNHPNPSGGGWSSDSTGPLADFELGGPDTKPST